ncbi:hypothetical protein PMAYCL1PPCAC_00368, partial [Pristionchus mayeri]
AYHIITGGANKETDRREYRLTLISFLVLLCDTMFFFFNIFGYQLDRTDFVGAVHAIQMGAPILPICHSVRTLCVPFFLLCFDSVIRARLLSPRKGGE